MAERDVNRGPQLSRRRVLQAAVMGGIATGIGAILAACGVKT